MRTVPFRYLLSPIKSLPWASPLALHSGWFNFLFLIKGTPRKVAKQRVNLEYHLYILLAAQSHISNLESVQLQPSVSLEMSIHLHKKLGQFAFL